MEFTYVRMVLKKIEIFLPLPPTEVPTIVVRICNCATSTTNLGDGVGSDVVKKSNIVGCCIL